jgi:valyl-tRNA synthetase
MSKDDFEIGRNFINKIWNAARFLLTKTEGIPLKSLNHVDLDLPSRWLVSDFQIVAKEIIKHLDSFQINEAVEKVYHLIWRSFCDWGLEAAKHSLDAESQAAREACASALIYVFEGALRLAAPVMPFVTEEIWSKIPRHPDWEQAKSLSVAKFPTGEELSLFEKEHADWSTVQELVTGIRSARQQAGVPLKDKLPVFMRATSEVQEIASQAKPWILRLSSTSELNCSPDQPRPSRCLVAIGRGFEAYIPVGDYLDFDKEKARLESEMKRVSKVVEGMRSKLSNPSFVDRAPAEVIEITKNQLNKMEAQLSGLAKNLEAVSG